ncbi:MAG: PKD domain-containing protein, partial [Deltaproteobacteria bacterium]|nr:PKD domain-containing protein [Deltaproteobacteria bacterium]MBW2534080.1 PKD domain-containing protein [Deltaproteobacteria bacterium]
MKRSAAAATCAALLACSTVVLAQPDPLVAVVDALPASGPAPLTVLLSGTRSTGKWGSVNSIETFEWDFTYDGATFTPDRSYEQNAVVAFTFDRPGTHTVRLRVTDIPNDGVPREA